MFVQWQSKDTTRKWPSSLWSLAPSWWKVQCPLYGTKMSLAAIFSKEITQVCCQPSNTQERDCSSTRWKQPGGPTLDTQQMKMKRWFVCSENIHQTHGWLDVLMQTVHTCLFGINCPHTAGDYNNRYFINFILHCLLQRPHQSGTLPDQTSDDYCDKFCTPTRLKLRMILPSIKCQNIVNDEDVRLHA